MSQTPNSADFLQAYQNASASWVSNAYNSAAFVFGVLTLISLGYSAAKWTFERTDLQTWVGALVHKVLTIGFMYTLMANGPSWLGFIVASFEGIGQRATGVRLAPDTIFFQGVNISGTVLHAAGNVGFFSGDVAAALIISISALVIAFSFFAICFQFVVAMVESYIVMSAGVIFLGFGGSPWTAPYVERVLSYAVGIGAKIMTIYLIVAVGQNLSNGWLVASRDIGQSEAPAMFALSIMGASLMYAMLAWQIPRIAAAQIGGAPALTGGDLLGVVGGMAAGTLAVTSGTAGVLGAGRAALGGGAVSGGATGASPAPPVPGAGSSGPAGTGSGYSGPQPQPPVPPAPSSAFQSQPAPPRAASARNTIQALRSRIPQDTAYSHAGPQLPIHPHD